MGPLDLSRIIKSEDMVAHYRIPAGKNIKQENGIKVEPKTEKITLPFHFKFPDSKPIDLTTNGFEPEVKCLASPVDTKSYDIFAAGLEQQTRTNVNNKRHKRKSSTSSTAPRRPILPIAIRVHQHLITKDPKTLSKKEVDSLTWAESIMLKTILRRSNITPTKELPNKVPNPFRETSTKIQPKNEFIVPNNLQLEIVDFSSPDRKYTVEQGRLIERAFNKAVVETILSKSVPTTPKFGMTIWRDGVLILDCKDMNSYNFARDTVSNIVPWRRAILRAIPIENDDLIYIAKFHAPDIDIHKNDVIKVLESQNPNIDMENWKVIEERTSQFGFKTYYLAITHPPVHFLQNKYLKILFGATELALEFVDNENIS